MILATDKLKRVYKRIPKHYKEAFLYALLFGVICHFYMMTNKITNHDDIEQLYNKMDLSTSGRWFLEYAGSIGSYFSMPWVNGSLILVYLSLSNALVIGLFNIKDRLLIILVSALTMSITTIVSLFVFMNSADAYYLGYLFSVLAAFLYIRNAKWGKFAFIFLNVFSLAIYQIFFGISISLVFIYYILEFINNKSTIKDTSVKVLLLGIISLFSLFAYVFSVKYIFKIELTSYKGIKNIGSIDFAYIPIGIARAYSEIYLFFLKDRLSQFDYIKYLNWMLFVSFFAMYGFILNKKLKSLGERLFAIILLLLTPLAINFIYIASGNTLVDLRMVGAYICVYIFIILIFRQVIKELDLYKNSVKKIIVALSYIIPIILVLTVSRFYIVTNKAYMTLDIDSRNLASYTTRVLTRIEEKSFYNKKKEIVFLGLPDISNEFSDSYTTDDVYAITYFRRKIPSRWHWTLYPLRYSAFPNKIQYFEKKDFNSNKDKELEKLIKKAQLFPKDEAIFEYNNKIYVKFVNYKKIRG